MSKIALRFCLTTLCVACSHTSATSNGSPAASPSATAPALWHKVPSMPVELQISDAVSKVSETTPSHEINTTFITADYEIVVRPVQRDALELTQSLAEAKESETANYQNIALITNEPAQDGSTFLLEFDGTDAGGTKAFVSYGRYSIASERIDCSGTAATAVDRSKITAACKSLRSK